MKSTIAKLLRGKKAGSIQTVGRMKMIPLFYQDDSEIDWSYTSPKNVFVSTDNYGSMRFHNEDPEKKVLVPSHYTILSKKGAQDHAMSYFREVGPKGEELFDNAYCVESSQCGFISPGKSEFSILPHALRQKSIEVDKNQQTGFNRLWDAIAGFHREVGVEHHRSHLIDFFEKYQSDLNDFVAQFENLPRQVGAIVLIDDQVAGIELTPNPDYWSDVWEPLIRGCYGSEYIRRRSHSNSKTTMFSVDGCKTIDDIRARVKSAKAYCRNEAANIVQKVMSHEVDLQWTSDTRAMVSNSRYNGHVLSPNTSSFNYISIVAQEPQRGKSDFIF